MEYITIDNLEQFRKVCLIYRKLGKLPFVDTREITIYDRVDQDERYKIFMYADNRHYYTQYYDIKNGLANTDRIIPASLFVCEYYLDKLEQKLKTK